MHKPEKKPENNIVPPEGAQPPSAGQPQSAEEMIVLNKLFPDAHRDLDTLFPDPNMKKLLKEVVESRKRNERFVKKIKSEVATEEEESE
jgi:hypothetical protein